MSERTYWIEKTGICKGCDQADMVLWKSGNDAFIDCKHEDACKRVEKLLTEVGNDQEES